MDADENILGQAKDTAEVSSRLQQQQPAEETCQAAVEAERVMEERVADQQTQWSLLGNIYHVYGDHYGVD